VAERERTNHQIKVFVLEGQRGHVFPTKIDRKLLLFGFSPCLVQHAFAHIDRRDVPALTG
jgi:hypothetical protein